MPETAYKVSEIVEELKKQYGYPISKKTIYRYINIGKLRYATLFPNRTVLMSELLKCVRGENE